MAKDESSLFVAALGAIVVGLFGCFMCMSDDLVFPAVGVRDSEEEGERQTDENSGTNIDTNNQEALGNHICIDKKVELRNDRYSHVLQNIIHKKVRSKSSQTKSNLRKKLDHLILPHEQVLSSRSLSIKNKESLVSSSWWVNRWYRKQIGTNFDKKNDIIIQTLRSIRSTLKLSNTDADSLHNTLYSPRTCPICCEDYRKGDDIAWSKNEKCCHAFHTDCIVPWLIENVDCPLCRSDYIYCK